MGFIERELNRIALALHDPAYEAEYDSLYAAQQAFSWAIEPTGFRGSYNMVMGIPEDLEDCSAAPHHSQS